MKSILGISVLAFLFSGCVPTMSQIRADCESRYSYGTNHYHDCVADGREDAEHKREALRHMGDGFKQAGDAFKR